ncbi:MAG: sugar transferase, partial [Chloroflexi bacterium]|nr:sugar transferase [Chloroflexota bacterium]
MLGDALMLVLAVVLAYAIRFHVDLRIFQTDAAGSPAYYLRLGASLVLLWLLLLAAVGAYRIQHLLGGTREYALVFNAISSGLILSVFATFLLPE